MISPDGIDARGDDGMQDVGCSTIEVDGTQRGVVEEIKRNYG